MSVIMKMTIQGIRSFGSDDNSKQGIDFQGPLTLILGQNGTGKTTIIECLKYITTGEAPPNTAHGAYFVLDPKIANQSEVLAQVRLKFRDSTGKETLVTRSCKSVQKQAKGKPNFSSIEAYIRRKDNTGKFTDLNAKCADINEEMICLLGVSKPVLTNVIFCHQEDSNWPLSEGKILKTKFDEIFSATRYAKALTKLQDERKRLGNQAKLDATHVDYLKANKSRADEKEKELSKVNVRMSASKEEVQAIEDKLIPIKERLREFKANQERFLEVRQEIEKKEALLLEMNNSVSSLRSNIKKEYVGSINELVNEIGRFKDKVEEENNHLKREKEKYDVQQEKSQAKQRELTELLVVIGKLESDHKRQLRRMSERNMSISKLCQECGITEKQPDASIDFTNEDVASKMNSLRQFIEMANKELEEKKQILEEQINDVQIKVDKLRDQKSKLEEKEASKHEKISTNKAEIEKVNIELEQIDSSAAILDQVDDELSSAEQELDKNSKSLDASVIQNEILDDESSLNEFSVKLDKTRKESSKARQLTEVRTKLDHLKKDKIAKETSIQKLYSKNEETLIALLGFVPKEKAKSMISEFLKEKSNEVNSQRNKLNALKIKLSKLETSRGSFQDQLSKLKKELDDSKDKIFNVCGSQSYSTVLKVLEQTVEALQKEKGALTGSQFVYKRFIEKLQASSPSACPLCHRGFDDPADSSELVNELKEKTESIPSRIKEKTNRLASEQKKYEDVLQVKPIEASYSKLANTDIPELENKIKKIEKEIEDQRQSIAENECTLSTLLSQESSARSISNDMGVLDQFQIELKKLDQQISSSSSKIHGDSVRTLQEIENDQQNIEAEMSLLRQSIKSKTERINQYQASVLECRNKITKLKEERQVLSESLNQKLTLEENQTKLIASNKHLLCEIQDIKSQMKPVQKELKRLEIEKTTKVGEKEKFMEQKYQELQDFKDQFRELQGLDRDINNYIKNEKEESLTEEKERLATLKQAIEEISKRSDKLKKSIDDLKQNISLQEVHQRNLKDNLQIKEKQKQIEKLSEEVKENEDKFEKMDLKAFESEKNSLNKTYNTLVNESLLAVGRQSELKESIRRLEKELKNPDYINADSKYSNKMIDMKTHEIATKDLIKYHDALDRALNQYHRIKMAEVNKIIRELWQLTYRGNDIDYIEIDCGEEPGSKGIKRNVYNYRVVLVKSNISLDMRGRCSAGQKVLASLIIRLALAETFCLQCGVLTLDEPTTNLDRENIASLAESLNNIVEMRSGQKNFQLIIITHDEEFIELLSRGRYADYFHKISKNNQGFSRITKYSIDRIS